MNDPKQEAVPLTGDVWPPPPAVASPVDQVKACPQWFRPALWLGIFFNVLACVPALSMLNAPNGSEQTDFVLIDVPHYAAIFTAALGLIIGIPFAIWQIRMRQNQRQSFYWEMMGAVLCLLPFFLGPGLMAAFVKAKALAPWE